MSYCTIILVSFVLSFGVVFAVGAVMDELKS